MRVKDQIRSRREALGMELGELARRLGVTEQAVRHWESGRSYPGKAKTGLLEEALSVTIDWSEGSNPLATSKTAASMIDQADVDLLLVICQLPLRMKNLIGDIARQHLEAVRLARPEAKEESPALRAARAAAAGAVAQGAVESATAQTNSTAKSAARKTTARN